MNMRRIPRYQEKPNVYLGGGIALAIVGCLVLYYTSRLHSSSPNSPYLDTCSESLNQSSKEKAALREMALTNEFEIVKETHQVRTPSGRTTEVSIWATRMEHWMRRNGQHGEYATGDTLRIGKNYADFGALNAEEERRMVKLDGQRHATQLADLTETIQIGSAAEVESHEYTGKMGNAALDVRKSKLNTDHIHAHARAVVKKRDSDSDSDSDFD